MFLNVDFNLFLRVSIGSFESGGPALQSKLNHNVEITTFNVSESISLTFKMNEIKNVHLLRVLGSNK